MTPLNLLDGSGCEVRDKSGAVVKDLRDASPPGVSRKALTLATKLTLVVSELDL